ncbi:hypothetical protein DL98DRAFT_507629 [Cadophora sp. DSE1049]|nr:hypothetical protein DL98DRAFT_507629 [Cadophora sp. DSE1049]
MNGKNSKVAASEHDSILAKLLPVQLIYSQTKNERTFRDHYNGPSIEASRSDGESSNIPSVQAPGSRTIGLQRHPRVSFPSVQGIVGASVQAQMVRAQFPQLGRPAIGTTISGGYASIHSLPPADSNHDLIMQPETRPISQEQLIAEVKGIYESLMIAEAKCIEVDNQQATSPSRLNNQQWQTILALHRMLMYEHHDFLLASQHPSASSALKRLATKHRIPARLWCYAIHSLLELLRHRLPTSLEHMLAFLYLAYSMTALLYETVPIFSDIWMEYLGDLSRYRIAIEDDDIQEQEVWAEVARHWYSKCSRRAVTTGRLYHHLAIMARPNFLQQLFYYAKSLCVPIPFESARESILTLFAPILNESQALSRTLPFEIAFVRSHGILFTSEQRGEYEYSASNFLRLLDPHIGRATRNFMEQGYHIAIVNAAAVSHFASTSNPLAWTIRSDALDPCTVQPSAEEIVRCEMAIKLSDETANIVLKRIGDPNVLPYIHVLLVFMHHMAKLEGDNKAMLPLYQEMMKGFPWEVLATFLTPLVQKDPEKHSHREKMPSRENSNRELAPFPEDFAMCGCSWVDTETYPDNYFSHKVFRFGRWREKYDEDDIYREGAGMTADRVIRILWYGHQLVKLGRLSFVQGRFLKSQD